MPGSKGPWAQPKGLPVDKTRLRREVVGTKLQGLYWRRVLPPQAWGLQYRCASQAAGVSATTFLLSCVPISPQVNLSRRRNKTQKNKFSNAAAEATPFYYMLAYQRCVLGTGKHWLCVVVMVLPPVCHFFVGPQQFYREISIYLWMVRGRITTKKTCNNSITRRAL